MRTKFVISVILAIMSIYVSAQTQSAHDLMQQFRYKEAIELLKTQPKTIENLLFKAESYEKLYNFSDALAVYEQLLLSNPDDVELIVSTAECASQAGNTEQSLKYWIKADSLSPGNLFFQTKKAMAYYRNGNWQETIESAQTVFESDSIPLILRMTGDAFLNTSNTDSAIWFYVKSIEKAPSDYLSVSKLGNLYYAAKFYDATINITDRYLTHINPNQTTIGQLNGMANYSSGNFEKAIDRLKANVELGDSSYTTTYFLGMSNYAKSWHYEAVKWLGKAYEINDKDVNLNFYYGTALGRVKNRDKAVEILQEGIDKINEMSEMLYGFDISMAEAYQNTNAYTKAIEYYLSAYKRQPDQHNLLYSIAHAYDSMNDYKNAIVTYERFLKTAPKDIDVAGLALAEGEKMDMKNFYYIVSYKRIEELQEKVFMQSGKKQP